MRPSYLGQLILDLNPLIAILPALLTAYFTYRLGKKKSDREERLEQMNYWRQKFEEAEKARINAESELAEERARAYDHSHTDDKGENQS